MKIGDLFAAAVEAPGHELIGKAKSQAGEVEFRLQILAITTPEGERIELNRIINVELGDDEEGIA